MGRRKKEEILELKRMWESKDEQNEGEEALDEVVFSDKDVCGQRGCFSYRDGHCECLGDTDFGGRACPFFKTIRQHEADIRSASGITGQREREAGKTENSSGLDFLKANADFMDELEELEDEADRIAKGATDMESTTSEDSDDGWDDDDDDSGGDGDEVDE